MVRTLPLVLTGCLWIGPAAHEERKASLAIELHVDGLTPEAWSTCVDEPPRFLVEGTVSAHHAGEPFDAWFQVEGDERRSLGTVTAGPAADDRAPISATLDLTETLALLPACGDLCELPLTVGLARLGLEDDAGLALTVLAPSEPTLAGVDLVDAAQARHDAAATPLAANPADSWSVEEYPFLVFELADPHLPRGFGGTIGARYCPDGLDPADAAACVVLPTEASTDVLAHGGDVAYRVPTAAFGEATCDPLAPAGRWMLWAVALDHVCASPIAVPVAGPFRFVASDCDGDGPAAPEDCDDLDATRSPDETEEWYDGVDADCSGGSDFDQDGDGVDGPTLVGLDCDDENPTVHPGADEVCDGFDNDCDDVEPDGVVTLYSPGGPVTYGPGGDPLGDALADMVAGDAIALCHGAYSGNFTVEADGLIAAVDNDPASTSLVAAVAGSPVLTVADGLDVELRGLGIHGGALVAEGGGVSAIGAASLVLEDCDVSGNDATRGGGLAVGGTVTIRRTTIAGNTAATEGGGLAAAAGTALVMEEDVVVSGNAADLGAGLHVADATVDLDATVSITANVAGVAGGGIWATGYFTLDEGTITANEAADGGGVYLDGDGTWELTDVVIRDHAAPALEDGGGVAASGAGVLTLTRVELGANSAGTSGGGLWASGPADPIDVTLVNCVIEDNDAGFEGGGVWIENGVLATRSGGVRRNLATHGAGIHARGAEVRVGSGLLGTEVTGNLATRNGGGLRVVGGAGLAPLLLVEGSAIDANLADYGGGVYLDPDDTAIVNAIDDGSLDGNDAATAGGGVYLDDGSLELRGSVYVGNNLANGLPEGGYVVDEVIEACTGVTVDDPISNGITDQGADTDCFEVSAVGVQSVCGC